MSDDDQDDREKHVAAGKKSAETKGEDGLKEAAGKAAVNRTAGKYLPALREFADNMKPGTLTNYDEIKKHFQESVEFYKESGNPETLRRQVYSATVNNPSRTDYQKKPRGYDKNKDIFFADTDYYPRSTGEGASLAIYVPGKKMGYWVLEMVDGELKAVDSDAAASNEQVAISFDQLVSNLSEHNSAMQANYLQVAVRTLLSHSQKTGWDTIAKDIEKMNSWYAPTKTGRVETAREMVAEQQGRHLFVGIRCYDEGGEPTTHPSKVVTCELALDEAPTEGQKKKLEEICGLGIAKWHARSRGNVKSWFVWAGHGGEKFDMFRKHSIIAADYGAEFDPSGMDTKEIKKELDRRGLEKGALELYNMSQIRSGDIIAVCTDLKTVREFAIATSDHHFDPGGLDGKDEDWNQADVEYLGFGTDKFGTDTQQGVRFDKAERIMRLFVDPKGVNGSPSTNTNMQPECKDWEVKGYFDMLERKRNMIFYGPPGTGKTWTARNVAECICKNSRGAGTTLMLGDEDTFEERLTKEMERIAEERGLSCKKRPGATAAQKQYSLKGDGVEIKVALHMANGSDNDEAESYFQVGNTEIDWFQENQKSMNFIIIYKQGIESFVCLPYEIHQKYAKFGGEGDGTGGWDSTGKGKHQVHNLRFDKEKAVYEAPHTNLPNDLEQKDVTNYLNTWFFAECIFSVTFHPSYSYEDFIEGYRPKKPSPVTVGTGGVAFPYHVNGQPVGSGSSSQYELADGIFKEAVEHAKKQQEEGDGRKTVLLIDEINRGNIPKIFGELITLIEKDKRGDEHRLRLTYSKEHFYVPDNLYIIGTMNTADKSLIQMDDALKRRFAFEELMPDTKALKEHMEKEGVKDRDDYVAILNKLNEKILNHNGPQSMKQFRDRQIGHSYFWNIKNDEDLKFVIKYEVIPLLQDYFFNDYGEIRNVLGNGKDDNTFIGKDNRPDEKLFENPKNLKEKLLDKKISSSDSDSDSDSDSETTETEGKILDSG